MEECAMLRTDTIIYDVNGHSDYVEHIIRAISIHYYTHRLLRNSEREITRRDLCSRLSFQQFVPVLFLGSLLRHQPQTKR